MCIRSQLTTQNALQNTQRHLELKITSSIAERHTELAPLELGSKDVGKSPNVMDKSMNFKRNRFILL